MTAGYVVDASVVVKWVVDEPQSDAARSLSGGSLYAPALLLLEVGNALWRRVIKGEFHASDASRRLASILRAPVKLVPVEELAGPALRLAAAVAHPIDDCAYLILAQQKNLPLVTADRRLIALAEARADLHRAVLPLEKLALI